MKLKVWAPGASQVWFCLFDDDGLESRFKLTGAEGGYWRGDFPWVQEGDRYGLRAAGPDLAFNPDKLLLDPQAQMLEGPLVYHPLMDGETPGDSAPTLPKCLLAGAADPQEPNPALNRPQHPWEQMVIMEAHVKGLTRLHPDIDPQLQGTYAALSQPAIIDYLKGLGITSLELLPVQAFLDDQFLVAKGLVNYWGYQPIAFSALEPRYAAFAQTGPEADRQFRQAVHALHEAGIEVILDLVFNHSGEGDDQGPTLSLRGLNDSGYYRKSPEGSYINDTGTGNSLALERPQVLALVMDSMRFFAQRYGVDGFRFDLASTLGRVEGPFNPQAAFFQAIAQDPVLQDLKLIAEPWDIGPEGYQLGSFPYPWREWNDRYRDSVRAAWRGEAGRMGQLASALMGSSAVFDHRQRPASSSINFLTAHDGFTLQDLVSYRQKHNEANLEDNRDGHGENYSDNLGQEGPSQDPQILQARRRRVRALLATLFLSQGVPMVLAGDEMGNSQGGNNNAYCQDNETTWLSWSAEDPDLPAYLAQLTALRRAFPQLRQPHFLHGESVRWWRADGQAIKDHDWDHPDFTCFLLELEGLLLVFNTGGELELTLPAHPKGRDWHLVFASDPKLAQSVRVYS